MHTFTKTEHPFLKGFFQIKSGHDIPKYNVKKGDLGGFVENKSQRTEVLEVTQNAWLDSDSTADWESYIHDSLVTNTSVNNTSIRHSVVHQSTIKSGSNISDSKLSGVSATGFNVIHASTISDVFLKDTRIDFSIIKLDDDDIDNANFHGALITEAHHHMSVSPIGSEDCVGTVYHSRHNGQPRIRVGCWNGPIHELLPEAERRLDHLRPELYARYMGQYKAFTHYAEAITETWSTPHD